jgi:hypothetical protein
MKSREKRSWALFGIFLMLLPISALYLNVVVFLRWDFVSALAIPLVCLAIWVPVLIWARKRRSLVYEGLEELFGRSQKRK